MKYLSNILYSFSGPNNLSIASFDWRTKQHVVIWAIEYATNDKLGYS